MRPRLRRFALRFEVYPRGHGSRVGLSILRNDDAFSLRDLLGVQHLCRAYRFGVELPRRFTLGFLGRVFVEEFAADRYRRSVAGRRLDALLMPGTAPRPARPPRSAIPSQSTMRMADTSAARPCCRRRRSITRSGSSKSGTLRTRFVGACGPATEPRAPTSGIGGAPPPKGGSFSTSMAHPVPHK